MPTTMTRSPGKTGFIKEFLNDNPEANTRAVNEAWRAAGFAGTISPTLVTKLRSQLGLTGNIRKGPGKKAEAEAAARPSGKRHGGRKGATGRGGNQGKTAFVTDQLRQDPDSSDEAINRAWAAAGNPGRISGSLMYQIRTREGLTGKRRSKRRGARKRGRPRSSPKGDESRAGSRAGGRDDEANQRTHGSVPVHCGSRGGPRPADLQAHGCRGDG